MLMQTATAILIVSHLGMAIESAAFRQSDRGLVPLLVAGPVTPPASPDALSPEDHARLAALDTTSDPLDNQNGRGELTLALAGNGRVREALAIGEQIINLPPEQTIGSRGDAFYGLGIAYASDGRPEAAKRAFSQAREVFVRADYRSMVTASLFDQLAVVFLPYSTDQPQERTGVEAELLESFAALNEVIDEQAARSAGVV